MSTPQSANAPEAAVKRQPHKHAELIKAWADGAKIQCRGPETGTWVDIQTPNWNTTSEYRLKPEKKWVRVAELIGGNTYTICSEVMETRASAAANFTRWITDRIYYE